MMDFFCEYKGSKLDSEGKILSFAEEFLIERNIEELMEYKKFPPDAYVTLISIINVKG